MSLDRAGVSASVRIYDRGAVSSITTPGFMSFDAVGRNWPIYDYSRYEGGSGWIYSGGNWSYVEEQYKSDRPDLVYVPGIEGLILRPHVLVSDSALQVGPESGVWVPYSSDNDPWGRYSELSEDTGGSHSRVSRDNLGADINIGFRLIRYQPTPGVDRDYSRIQQSPGTIVKFANSFCIYVPYSGPALLMEYDHNQGQWNNVLTLNYDADSAGVTDAVEFLVMYINGKIVITSDWFASTSIYEKDGGISLKPGKVAYIQRGGRALIALRKLRFPTVGSWTRKTMPWKLRGDTDKLQDVTLVPRTSGTGTNQRLASVEKVLMTVDPNRPWVGELNYKATLAGNGFNTSVYYGTLAKVEPVVSDSAGLKTIIKIPYVEEPNYVEISSDTVDLTLDEPAEKENSRVTGTLSNITKITSPSGEAKLKYAHLITDPQPDGFEGLGQYMYIGVDFNLNMYDTEAKTTSVETQRSWYGIIKDPTATRASEVSFEFTAHNLALQFQEVMCDGSWGPYDGMYVVEALQHVCWECGFPTNRFLVRGPVLSSVVPPYTKEWFTVDELLSGLNGYQFDHWVERYLTRLDVGYGKESRWKPRPGETGWDVTQWLAEYEHGRFFVDGFYAYYDPNFWRASKWTLGGANNYLTLTPDSRTVSLRVHDTNIDTAAKLDPQYGGYSSLSTGMDSSSQHKVIVVAGQRIVGNRKYAIAAIAKNGATDSTSSPLFIPFNKGLVVANPAWNKQALLNDICRKLASRFFHLARDVDVVTYGHPEISPMMVNWMSPTPGVPTLQKGGLEVDDDNLANHMFVDVTNATHKWSSSDNFPWGQTTFRGPQMGKVVNGVVMLEMVTE